MQPIRGIVLALAAFETAFGQRLDASEIRETMSKMAKDSVRAIQMSDKAAKLPKQTLEKSGAPALRSLATCADSSSTECIMIFASIATGNGTGFCTLLLGPDYGYDCVETCFGFPGAAELSEAACTCSADTATDAFGGSYSYSFDPTAGWDYCVEDCADAATAFYTAGSFSYDFCEFKEKMEAGEGCSFSGTCVPFHIPSSGPVPGPTMVPMPNPSSAPVPAPSTVSGDGDDDDVWPNPSSAPVPAPSTVSGDGDDDDVCFSGDSIVQLASGATKAMADLEVGDSILSADAAGKLSFSDVVFLPHGTNSKKADFVAVTTESGKIVKATPSHLLQACDGSLVQAKAASCLRTVDGAESVKSIEQFKAEGIYTAVTLKNEFLVVDGVVASPFALAHTLADAYYNAHRALYAVSPSLVKVPLMVPANSLVGAAAVYVVRSLRSLHQDAKSVIF